MADYRTRLFQYIKANDDSFILSEKSFYDKLNSSDYKKRLFSYIKENDNSFTLNENDFYNRVSSQEPLKPEQVEDLKVRIPAFTQVQGDATTIQTSPFFGKGARGEYAPPNKFSYRSSQPKRPPIDKTIDPNYQPLFGLDKPFLVEAPPLTSEELKTPISDEDKKILENYYRSLPQTSIKETPQTTAEEDYLEALKQAPPLYKQINGRPNIFNVITPLYAEGIENFLLKPAAGAIESGISAYQTATKPLSKELESERLKNFARATGSSITPESVEEAKRFEKEATEKGFFGYKMSPEHYRTLLSSLKAGKSIIDAAFAGMEISKNLGSPIASFKHALGISGIQALLNAFPKVEEKLFAFLSSGVEKPEELSEAERELYSIGDVAISLGLMKGAEKAGGAIRHPIKTARDTKQFFKDTFKERDFLKEREKAEFEEEQMPPFETPQTTTTTTTPSSQFQQVATKPEKYIVNEAGVAVLESEKEVWKANRKEEIKKQIELSNSKMKNIEYELGEAEQSKKDEAIIEKIKDAFDEENLKRGELINEYNNLEDSGRQELETRKRFEEDLEKEKEAQPKFRTGGEQATIIEGQPKVAGEQLLKQPTSEELELNRGIEAYQSLTPNMSRGEAESLFRKYGYPQGLGKIISKPLDVIGSGEIKETFKPTEISGKELGAPKIEKSEPLLEGIKQPTAEIPEEELSSGKPPYKEWVETYKPAIEELTEIDKKSETISNKKHKENFKKEAEYKFNKKYNKIWEEEVGVDEIFAAPYTSKIVGSAKEAREVFETEEGKSYLSRVREIMDELGIEGKIIISRGLYKSTGELEGFEKGQSVSEPSIIVKVTKGTKKDRATLSSLLGHTKEIQENVYLGRYNPKGDVAKIEFKTNNPDRVGELLNESDLGATLTENGGVHILDFEEKWNDELLNKFKKENLIEGEVKKGQYESETFGKKERAGIFDELSSEIGSRFKKGGAVHHYWEKGKRELSGKPIEIGKVGEERIGEIKKEELGEIKDDSNPLIKASAGLMFGAFLPKSMKETIVRRLKKRGAVVRPDMTDYELVETLKYFKNAKDVEITESFTKTAEAAFEKKIEKNVGEKVDKAAENKFIANALDLTGQGAMEGRVTVLKDKMKRAGQYLASMDFLRKKHKEVNDLAWHIDDASEVGNKLNSGVKEAIDNIKKDITKKVSETIFKGNELKKVFNDEELKTEGLNDKEVGVYKEIRRIVGEVLDFRRDKEKIEIQDKLDEEGVEKSKLGIEGLEKNKKETSEIKKKLKEKVFSKEERKVLEKRLDKLQLEHSQLKSLIELDGKYKQLKNEGYISLVRFGEFSIFGEKPTGEATFSKVKTHRERVEKEKELEEQGYKVHSYIENELPKDVIKRLSLRQLDYLIQQGGIEYTTEIKNLRNELMSKSGVKKYEIERKFTAGYETTPKFLVESIVNQTETYANNYATSIGGSRARKELSKLQETGFFRDKGSLEKVLNNYIDVFTDKSRGESVIGRAMRKYTYTMQLGFALKQLVFNALQAGQMSHMLARTEYGLKGIEPETYTARGYALAGKRGVGKADAEFNKYMTELEKRGEATGTSAQSQIEHEKISSKDWLTRLKEKDTQYIIGVFDRVGDSMARKVTASIFYLVGKEKLGLEGEALLKFMAENVQQVNSSRGLHNAPYWVRKSGEIGKQLYMFRRFQQLYTEQIINSIKDDIKNKRIASSGRVAAQLLIMGGLLENPISDMASSIYSAITDDDLQNDIEKYGDKKFGEGWTDLAAHGVYGLAGEGVSKALNPLNLRTNLLTKDFDLTNIRGIAPAITTIQNTIVEGVAAGKLERILPRGIRNAYEGYMLTEKGLMDRSGKKILVSNKNVKLFPHIASTVLGIPLRDVDAFYKKKFLNPQREEKKEPKSRFERNYGYARDRK